LLYELQHGADEAIIIEQAQRLKMPLPDFIKNKPVLPPGLDFYMHAFQDVSTDRAIGMAEGPIPWSAVDRWAARHGVVGEEFDRLVIILRLMDEAYITYRSKEHKKQADRAHKGAIKPAPKDAIVTKR
jgi:hypothetical protein